MAWQVEGEEAAPAASTWKEEAPATWWDTAKNAGQTVDDGVRAAANAMTFGMADRFAGYMGGKGTDAEVAQSATARERSPYASVAGDVGGSLAVPGLGAEALAARMGGGLLARGGAYGATGAVTGAAQGAGNTYTGNLPDYLQNAGIGGALGGAFGSVGGAMFGRGPATSRAPAPTSSELHDASTAGYGALARSGAGYEPQAFHKLANDTEQSLLADRYHWRDSPATWRGIEEMRGGGAPGQINTGANAIVDPAGIDFVRKGLNRIPKNESTATDRSSADVVRKALDDFIIKPPPGAVLPGLEREAKMASQRAVEARDNWAGYKRTQKLDDLITGAQNTAGSNNSGLNLQAELRKGVRTFIKPTAGESPASKAGFIAPEVAALTDYTRGTNGTNALRYVSNMMGGGGGLGAVVAGGVAGGASRYFKDDPELAATLGIGTPIAGAVLRGMGNRRANADISALRDMIARRTPMYDFRANQSATMQGMQPGAGRPATAKTARDAIALEILKQRQSGE